MLNSNVECLKKKYIPGTRIKLIRMDDIQAPPAGSTGEVEGVDDIGTIHVKWANGGSLGLIEDVDEFEII